jgi:HPt (histidine-containing phosphotransfer) domain-containing protein
MGGCENHEGLPLLDKEAALLQLQGDEEFLNELLSIFRTEIPGRLKKLNTAIQNKNISEIAHEAHSLKGVCMTIGAKSCQETALDLERAAKKNDEAAVYDIFPSLKAILNELADTLSN